MNEMLEILKEMVVDGKHKEIEAQVQSAIDSGIDLNGIINDALISAMDIIGKRFADGEIYVPEMHRVIEALEAEGLRDNVKVIVGGAPIDKKFADKIGADGYAKDAAEAVQLARELVSVG